jgi:hypothetical protein
MLAAIINLLIAASCAPTRKVARAISPQLHKQSESVAGRCEALPSRLELQTAGVHGECHVTVITSIE